MEGHLSKKEIELIERCDHQWVPINSWWAGTGQDYYQNQGCKCGGLRIVKAYMLFHGEPQVSDSVDANDNLLSKVFQH